MDRNYTLAITSCGRPELLHRTLDSFMQMAEQGPRHIITIDDAGMDKPEWYPRHNSTWIKNENRIGLVASLDKLYAEIKTEAIFHCEDDWQFYAGGFITQSFWILETHPKISTVSLRRDYRFTEVKPYAEGVQIFDPTYGWNGFTWNPGLRRKSDYDLLGSYGRYLGYGRVGLDDAHAEKRLSELYLRLGYNVAAIPRHCYHIGDESHVARSTEPLPRILVAIPTANILDYSDFRRKIKEVYPDRKCPNGVSGLQIDGPNLRQQAVRETWLKDAAVHPNLSVQFFDGVRCGCPDDHMHVIDKFLFACRYAQEQGFDWLVKVDDDTLLRLDGLIRTIIEIPRDIHAAGYVEGGGFYGGPGFMVDREALKFIATLTPPDRWEEWREDWWVGDCLRRAGFQLKHLMQLKDKWREAPPIETVSLHPLSPDEMRSLYTPLL